MFLVRAVSVVAREEERERKEFPELSFSSSASASMGEGDDQAMLKGWFIQKEMVGR